MEILSVKLENFKSHRESYFEFQSGTNAICGENGAGKTSILEAIAWTLFNHSDYSKDDLIRKGTAQAQVVVKFISSLDGRTYQIQRCTKRGYELYDPQLKRKLDYTKIEDVMPWLREHLGVAQNTELPKLFAETIGIPQGTLTSDFLKRGNERKKIFDPILKVEEYKQAFTQAKDLEHHAKLQVSQLEQTLIQYEQQLQSWEELKQHYQILDREITTAEVELSSLTEELTLLQKEKDELTDLANQIQDLTLQLQKTNFQRDNLFNSQQRLHQTLEKAQSSEQICSASQTSYQTYQQAERSLADLAKAQKNRQTLVQQRAEYESRLTQRTLDLIRLKNDVENRQASQAKLTSLLPLIERQTALESQLANLESELQEIRLTKREKQKLESHLTELQARQNQLQVNIQNLRSLETTINQIPALENSFNIFREQLSRIEAGKQFQGSLSQLVITAEKKRDRYHTEVQKVLNLLDSHPQLKPSVQSAFELGNDLNSEILDSLQQILADLNQQVSVAQLQQKIQALQGQLNTAYQCRTDFASLQAKLTEQHQLETNIQQTRSHLEQLDILLAKESQIVKTIENIQHQLKELNNPRGTAQILAQEIQKFATVQQKYEHAQQFKVQLVEALQTLDEQLTEFAQLDSHIEQQNQLKSQHQSGYLNYLKHEEAAQQLPSLEAELKAAIALLQELETQHQSLQTESDRLKATYDPQQRETVEITYNLKIKQQAQIQGSLSPKRNELSRIQQQLDRCANLAQERDRATQQLAKRQKALQFVSDARNFYNQASPRITKFYLEEISREADKLFRELLNRQNVALEWTEDYEIMVQEDGHRRGFKSLSGGEQMCAALAVRLALLRIIADIDVAFFDEPTTNMDVPRRRQLADALARLSGTGSNIKTFRQLFVISHDDTFENLSHFIHVQRQ